MIPSASHDSQEGGTSINCSILYLSGWVKKNIKVTSDINKFLLSGENFFIPVIAAKRVYYTSGLFLFLVFLKSTTWRPEAAKCQGGQIFLLLNYELTLSRIAELFVPTMLGALPNQGRYLTIEGTLHWVEQVLHWTNAR